MRSTPPLGRQLAFDWRPTPMVLRLMVVTVSIWLGFSLLINFAEWGLAYQIHDEYLALTPQEYLSSFHVWSIFTYMWLHELAGASHVLFNMLGLYFLGPALERRWGSRAFLRFYVLAGVIAGGLTLLAGWVLPDVFGYVVSPLGQRGPMVSVVGASGAIMALVAAYSVVMPRAKMLLFFVVPVSGKWLIWIVLAVDTAIFLGGDSQVAYQTHVGGMIAAWLLITGNWRPRLAGDRLRLWLLARRRRKRRAQLKVVKGGKADKDQLN